MRNALLGWSDLRWIGIVLVVGGLLGFAVLTVIGRRAYGPHDRDEALRHTIRRRTIAVVVPLLAGAIVAWLFSGIWEYVAVLLAAALAMTARAATVLRRGRRSRPSVDQQ